MRTSNCAVNSSLLGRSNAGSAKEAPFSSHPRCLGLILFDKLNEKYCGNSLSSMRSRRISHTKKIHLWPQILLYAVAEELRKPPRHGQRIARGEPDSLQELQPRETLLLHAAGEHRGVPRDWGDTEHMDEVEGGDEVGDEDAVGDGGARK